MKMEGSCHCAAVTFSVTSVDDGQPYLYCYCSICRKTQGGGGYAINLFGRAATLKVRGRNHIKVYRVRGDQVEGGTKADRRTPSEAQRHFCGKCGSALWVYDPRWPTLIHPFASAIDTALPRATSRTHIMLDYKPAWVTVPKRDRLNRLHKVYPPGDG